MAYVKCEYCNIIFDKSQKRINRTEKLGQKHLCSRQCASKSTNDNRRCMPNTKNAENTRLDKEKFPEKNLARSLVRRAIKSGKLVPLKECEICGIQKMIQAHHPDHSRPFFLLYLCKDCHNQADTDINKYAELATDYSGCII